VFAAEFSKHLSSRDGRYFVARIKRKIGKKSPDLLALINHILQEELRVGLFSEIAIVEPFWRSFNI
jgi:hypothetical protein